MSERESLFASQRHLVEIASGMFNGYTAECSCGWRSEEMTSNRAAWDEGNRHYAEGSAMALALNQRDEAQREVTRLRDKCDDLEVDLDNAISAFNLQCNRISAIEKILGETGYASEQVERIADVIKGDPERFAS